MAKLRQLILGICLLALTLAGWAGGGPQQVLVVMNGNSRESLELGNLYRRARDIPYRQTIALTTATAPAVSYQTYLDEIETPIRQYLRAQELEDEITTLVLVRGIPPQVNVANGRATTSLLAALGAGKGNARIANPYLNSPLAFSRRQEALNGYYLVTMLNALQAEDVKRLIAQGLQADGTLPDGRFVLQTAPQLPRGGLAGTAELLTQRGLLTEVTPTPPADHGGLMGYLSGGIYAGVTEDLLADTTFRPGGIADLAQPFSATGKNFADSEPPVLLPVGAFIRAGAAGVHGVVGEPGTGNFPMTANPRLLLDRYTSGFSLAESFFAALPVLNWQNVVLGDPLTAPYARRPSVQIEAPLVLQGTVALKITATAGTRGATIARMRLYLDDRLIGTVYEPADTRVTLRVGERVVEYILPAGATLQQLLEGLAAVVNVDPVLSAPEGVLAVPQVEHGVLQLLSRRAGGDGNGMPVAISLDSRGGPALVTARVGRGMLLGGGVGPSPARGTVSLVGRRALPGDLLDIQVQNEHIRYTVPDPAPPLPALLDELAARLNAMPSLQRRAGVKASRDPDGMPVLLLEARTPGEAGNRIVYQVTLTPVAGSQLKGYPDVLTAMSGGQEGSTAALEITFALGDAAPTLTTTLDTITCCDGAHRLRVVAVDGSPAQVQGWTTQTVLVRNHPDAPAVRLPDRLGPVADAVDVPVTAEQGIERVEFYLDGRLRGSSVDAPFGAKLPLDGVGRGEHDLWAEGIDGAGLRYRSRMCTLEVRTPPEMTHVSPESSPITGGTVHTIIGAGFQPGCRVRLSGIPARTVTVLSPNLLQVVSDAGPVGRGEVVVSNPDALQATLPNAFEYYRPRLTTVTVQPARDIITPGGTGRFQAVSVDQFGRPIDTPITWEALGGGSITPEGLYRAPQEAGADYLVRALGTDGREAARAQVTVGPALLPADGWLRQWLVLDAFPDPDYTALLTPLLDEPTVTPAHGEIAGERTWRSLYAANTFVDLASVLTPNTHAVTYAHVYLQAPADTPALLVFGASDGIRLWLNGAPIFSQRTSRTAVDPDQNTVPITLAAGWNRLLVKVDQDAANWGFYLRLRPVKGKEPLPDIRYTLDRKDTVPLPAPQAEPGVAPLP